MSVRTRGARMKRGQKPEAACSSGMLRTGVSATKQTRGALSRQKATQTGDSGGRPWEDLTNRITAQDVLVERVVGACARVWARHGTVWSRFLRVCRRPEGGR